MKHPNLTMILSFNIVKGASWVGGPNDPTDGC